MQDLNLMRESNVHFMLQSGNPNAPGMQSNFGLQSGIPPPLPPGPPPHGQAHQ